jgi:hypothetical protein
MEWIKIINLPEWTPLASIGDEVERVTDDLFKVGLDAYVRTRQVNRNYEENDPNSPFVTKAYWACTVDAVKRDFLGDPALGAEAPKEPPPSCLLMDGAFRYGDLTDKARELSNTFAERAIYSNSGQFLYKAVSVGPMKYCFLNPEEDRNEPTFLIQVTLPSV